VSFDWMNPRATRNRPREDENRRAMYRGEITDRAGLLRRLGYTQAGAVARLRANLEWDFEQTGGTRPDGLTDKDLSKLVKAAFER
jgi:hypothetical protein